MNRKEYNSDSRYAKVLEQMDLLGIMDVSTTRQRNNGTITWKLPIKNEWKNSSFIEVASFKTGYVRNNNSASSNYQLNKRCEGEPEYFELPNGDYRKYTTRTCKLIPIVIDRLEYLIRYCLKNYYIKHANFVADGEYVAKWKYDEAMDLGKTNAEAESINDCGHYDRINELEDSLEGSDYRIKDLERMLDGYKGRETNHDQELEKAHDEIEKLDDSNLGYKSREKNLKDKLDKAEKNEFYPYSMEIRVNGQKYKVDCDE